MLSLESGVSARARRRRGAAEPSGGRRKLMSTACPRRYDSPGRRQASTDTRRTKNSQYQPTGVHLACPRRSCALVMASRGLLIGVSWRGGAGRAEELRAREMLGCKQAFRFLDHVVASKRCSEPEAEEEPSSRLSRARAVSRARA
jgi:hypothetical protein